MPPGAQAAGQGAELLVFPEYGAMELATLAGLEVAGDLEASLFAVSDRLPEAGGSKSYGFDQNYEYKIYGRYTGRTLYEPNSNQFLPEFLLTNYEVLDTNPGWLFSPQRYQ